MLWKHETGGWVDSSPVIGPDGAVYAGSFDHRLYAFQGASPPALSAWPQFAADFTRTGRAPNSFAAWLTEWGINPENANSGDDDPAGDGTANLVKYALEISPHDFTLVNLPEFAGASGGDFVYAFPIDRSKRDIVYQPEFSDDLRNWVPLDFEMVDSPEAVTAGRIAVSSEENPAAFLRVRILLNGDVEQP